MVNTLWSRSQQFITDLQTIQKRADRSQQDISSGIRIRAASDAPDQINRMLKVQSELSSNEQIKKNLTVVKAEVDTGSNVLQNALKQLDYAIGLGSQASSGTSDTNKRQILAGQIENVLKQMVNLSSTTVNNRYIFSGDEDGAPSYQLNLDNPSGVDQLSNASATRQIQGPDGTTFTVAKTAQELWDQRNADGSAAPGNVFAALNRLRNAVLSGTDTAITSAIGQLDGAQSYLNGQAVSYGNLQRQLSDASDQSDQYKSAWTIRLGEIRDTDLPSAILEMQQSSTQLNAAISAQAQRPRTTLFDFLK